MSLSLRLRKKGSNIYRSYQIDDSQYVVPDGTEDDHRESVVGQLSRIINNAAIKKGYAQVSIKNAPKTLLRFQPNTYKMLIVEYTD